MSTYPVKSPPGSVLEIGAHPDGVALTLRGLDGAEVRMIGHLSIVISREAGIELAGELLAHAAPELSSKIDANPLAFVEAALSRMLGPPDPNRFTAAPLPRCEELVGVDANGAGVQCELPARHLGPHQVRERDRDSGNGVTS